MFFTSCEVGIRCLLGLGVGSCLRQHRKIQENTMILNSFDVNNDKTKYFSLVFASVIWCCTALINVTLGLLHALFLNAGLGRYCSTKAPGWFPDWAARVRFAGVAPGVLLCSPSGWGPNRVPQQNKRSHIYIWRRDINCQRAHQCKTKSYGRKKMAHVPGWWPIYDPSVP